MSMSKFFLGSLIGRAILISVFAYIIWNVYNMNTTPTPTDPVPEARRFGRSGTNRFGTRSYRRFGTRSYRRYGGR
jgi:hypothetical protein